MFLLQLLKHYKRELFTPFCFKYSRIHIHISKLLHNRWTWPSASNSLVHNCLLALCKQKGKKIWRGIVEG